MSPSDVHLKKEMEKYFDRLFPICRSITGPGYQTSLDILGELLPLEKHDFPTGTQCFDWTVPDEWVIRDAYILTPDGEKIADFSESNLHVVGYSEAVDREVSLAELKKHLHTLPDLPGAIPYVTSYYSRDWGFCLAHEVFQSLLDGTYRVFIDSDLKPGKLTIGTLTIPGQTEEQILLSTYLCHPSLAVNELSGPLVTAFLYRRLKEYIERNGKLRHSVTFVVCPENIGAIAFLSKFGDQLRRTLKAGYVINCVGHGKNYTYKKSRQGNSLADRAALNVLQHLDCEYETRDFVPQGSDERMYCSPGFNFPVGLVMRTMFGEYPEYHTSKDNKELLSFDVMREVVDVYMKILLTIDGERKYCGRVQYGTPQLSKSPIPVYSAQMKCHGEFRPDAFRAQVLDLLNYSDGQHTLLDIAEKRGHLLLDLIGVAEKLAEAGYLKELDE